MTWAIQEKSYSQRRACGLVRIDPKTYRYASRRPDDGQVRGRLRELANACRRFGYRRLHILLKRARGKTLMRLRIVLEEAGWTVAPGVGPGARPIPTRDRLLTALTLARESGLLDQGLNA